MPKISIPYASAAEESTFIITAYSFRSSIKAASWEEAHNKGRKLMLESGYCNETVTDKYGPQWVSYTVYRVPEDVYVDPKGDAYLEILEDCESQDATYAWGWEE